MIFLFLSTFTLFEYKEMLHKIHEIQPAIYPQIWIALAHFDVYFRKFWLEVVTPESFVLLTQPVERIMIL